VNNALSIVIAEVVEFNVKVSTFNVSSLKVENGHTGIILLFG